MAIDATVGGASANSYETLAEANTFFADERLPLTPPWVASGAYNAQALIMATRGLDLLLDGKRVLVRPASGTAYYVVRRTWTGAPATTTQRLAWPRIGMFTANGVAISASVIPKELKDAESEFAGQLLGTDRTLDSDVIVQGVTSVRAGSVSVSFKDGVLPQVMPDAVLNLMPSSWFTDEQYEYTQETEVELL